MSFQAYLDIIQTRAGQSPQDFRRGAAAKGFAGIAPGVKATRITDGRNAGFDPGQGHAMAIFALLNGKKE